MSPYKIMSSRLFQTRLSHPPRIIAFVRYVGRFSRFNRDIDEISRLETRSAAEEIIERLHGRMVRGWNDPGSRISVRFADTAEQRELRVSRKFNGKVNLTLMFTSAPRTNSPRTRQFPCAAYHCTSCLVKPSGLESSPSQATPFRITPQRRLC